jgi:hypothetical protein
MGAMYTAEIPTRPFARAASTLIPFAVFAQRFIDAPVKTIQLVWVQMWCQRLSTHSELSVRCVIGAGNISPASWAENFSVLAAISDPAGREAPIQNVLLGVTGSGVAQGGFVGTFRPRRSLNVRFARGEGPIATLRSSHININAYLGIMLAYEATPPGSFVEAEIGGIVGYEDLT